MTITVCAGSSCSHRGSQKVVEYLVNFISTNSLQDRWKLKASFCMKDCGEHFCVQIDDYRLKFLPNSDYRRFFKELLRTNELPNIAGITWRRHEVK
jgi:NADH:ubiquinone oxidoreductase subunit E